MRADDGERDAAPSPPHPHAPRREIVGWGMFDFANQAYTLLIVSVVFGDLFTRVIVGDRGDDFRLGNLLWSLSLSVSYLLVVATAPLFGAIMDATASKKRFLFASYLATVVTTTLLYAPSPGWIGLAMVLLIISNYAYSLGDAFIASFLPELGPRESLGRISGFGWALGYVGGLVCAGLGLWLLGEVSLENFARVRWVGPLTGGFFLLAAIPTFLWLRERGTPHRLPAGRSYLSIGAERVRASVKSLSGFRDLATLLLSIFFSMAGLYIVITFAFIYGAQVIGWDGGVRNTMFIVVQITAAAGAFGFGHLQDRIGAKRTYLITLALWIAAIAAIYATPQLARFLRGALGVSWEAQHVFLVVGCLAGLSLGSSQSSGRALVGVLAPRSRSAEMFGFWSLAGKLAAVVGLVGLGLLQVAFGLERAILFCIALFGTAFVIGTLVDEQRGREAARLAERDDG